MNATNAQNPSSTVKPTFPWNAPRSVLLTAAWWGLLTGFIKVIGIYGFYSLRATPLSNVSQYDWMFPINEAIWGFAFGLPFFLWALWGGVTPVLRALIAFLFAFACIGASTVTIVTLGNWRLYSWATVLLSLGVAVQAARLAKNLPAINHRLMVATAALMITLTVLLCAGIEGRIWWVQRQLLSTLPDAPAGSPNVLLIVLDTVRAPSLSLYGYRNQTTPNLQQWASQGVIFDHAVTSAPFTLTSHSSMFTGHYPTELDADWCRPLGNQYPTLAEVLHDKGYLTVGVAANCALLGWQTGLDRGFAWYWAHLFKPPRLFLSSLSWNLEPRMMNATEVNSHLVNWLNDDYDGTHPFFAFINYIDCHAPYHSIQPQRLEDRAKFWERQKLVAKWTTVCFKAAKSPTDTAMIDLSREAYDDSIHTLDREINALLTNLRMQGLLKNTLVIIVADHGEQFGEHDLVQHADSVYHPAIHVPLVIIPPNCAAPGRRIEQIVTIRDIPATILDLLNIRGTPIAGDSFAAALGPDPSTPLPDLPKFAYINKGINYTPWHPNASSPVHAVFLDGKEYIRNDRSQEMYDFINDPTEQHNLIDSPDYSSLVARCRQLLANQEAQGGHLTQTAGKTP